MFIGNTHSPPTATPTRLLQLHSLQPHRRRHPHLRPHLRQHRHLRPHQQHSYCNPYCNGYRYCDTDAYCDSIPGNAC